MEPPWRKILLVANLLKASLPKRTRHSAPYPANYTGYKLSYYWVSGYWLVIFHIACEQAHLCEFSLNSHKWARSQAIFCIELTFYHRAIMVCSWFSVVHGKGRLLASQQWEVCLTMNNLISRTSTLRAEATFSRGLLFARQLIPRKCSLCSLGTERCVIRTIFVFCVISLQGNVRPIRWPGT